MLEERLPLENLFTFGDGQFQQFLTEGRKEKFPFLQCIKIKKTPILRKLISEERERQSENNENIESNNNVQPKTLREKGRLISYHEAKKVRFSFDKEDLLKEYGKNSPSSIKEKRKISLPKVMKNVFPDSGLIPIKKRKISSAYPSMRYVGEDEEIKFSKNLSISSQREESFREVRPKSVMLLSEIISEGSEERIRTIQHRKRVYSKVPKEKIEEKKSEIGNKKIQWNINELKKLYC